MKRIKFFSIKTVWKFTGNQKGFGKRRVSRRLLKWKLCSYIPVGAIGLYLLQIQWRQLELDNFAGHWFRQNLRKKGSCLKMNKQFAIFNLFIFYFYFFTLLIVFILRLNFDLSFTALINRMAPNSPSENNRIVIL